MSGADHRSEGPGSRSTAALQRDAALRRIGRTRGWTIAGASALTAGLALLVSAVAPGRTPGAKSQSAAVLAPTAQTAPATATSAPKLPPLASPGALGLQGPNQAPAVPQSAPPPAQSSQPAPAQSSQPAGPPQPSGVVSGGS